MSVEQVLNLIPGYLISPPNGVRMARNTSFKSHAKKWIICSTIS